MASSADGIRQSGSDFPASAGGKIANAAGTDHWSVAKRIAFRFCFIYFTLVCFSNQIIGVLFSNPAYNIPQFGELWPMRPITVWTARLRWMRSLRERLAGRLVAQRMRTPR